MTYNITGWKGLARSGFLKPKRSETLLSAIQPSCQVPRNKAKCGRILDETTRRKGVNPSSLINVEISSFSTTQASNILEPKVNPVEVYHHLALSEEQKEDSEWR